MSIPQRVAAVAIVALQLTTTSIVVGFAERDSLLVRIGGMALALLAAHSQLAEERVQHPIVRPFLGAASVFLVVMYVDAALLSRWAFDARGPTSSLGGLDPNLGRSGQGKLKDSNQGSETIELRSRSVVARLRFGFYVALQSRFPCTPWGVKHTQGFLSSEVPSRVSFILPTLLKITICTLILRVASSLGDAGQNAVLFSSAKVPLFGNIIDPTAGWSSCIDWEQLHLRALAVLGYWTVQYLIINLLYDCLAVFAVTLHITEVDVWPPVFGRADEAWSLRQFWGEFYHQLIRRGCSSIAHLVTYPVLHLPKGSLVARYMFLSLVFAVSAIFHLLSDISLGIPVHESGALVFFCCQTPATMLEDLVLAVSKRLVVNSGMFGVTRHEKFNFDAMPLSARICIRTIGYLWVITWLTCMSPVWIYPAMRRDTGVPLIPF